MFRKSNNRATSRLQIDIQQVKDGIMILPGNRARLILQVSSLNFELKSEAEQDALIETYQSVLNSLVSPLQIIICIQEVDLDKYIESFNARVANEKKLIYKQQIAHYSEFVARLVKKNKILSRQFYVVLACDAPNKAPFEVIREQLDLSADIVSKGLNRLGMQARQLTSLELMDFFYSFYNPDLAKSQPITKQTLELLSGAAL